MNFSLIYNVLPLRRGFGGYLAGADVCAVEHSNSQVLSYYRRRLGLDLLFETLSRVRHILT